MAAGIIKNVKVSGIVCAVPDNRQNIVDVFSEKFGQKYVSRFVKLTGVESRCIAIKEQTASDLCFEAANNLIASLGWEKSDIDALFFVSQSPDYISPATSSVLHFRLGLSKNAISMDISMGCSGFVYGFATAAQYMQNMQLQKVLLLCGNMSSRAVCPDDRSLAMLFGDAGAAVALELDRNCAETPFFLKTDGSGFRYNIVPAGRARLPDAKREPYMHEDECMRSDYDFILDSANVFNFSITELPESIDTFFKTFSIDKDVLDYFVLHQANLHLIKMLSRKINAAPEKLLYSISNYGNTSTACIPVTLCNNANVLQKSKISKLFMTGYGAGFSYGGMVLSLNTTIPLKVLHTNKFFQDGVL